MRKHISTTDIIKRDNTKNGDASGNGLEIVIKEDETLESHIDTDNKKLRNLPICQTLVVNDFVNGGKSFLIGLSGEEELVDD